MAAVLKHLQEKRRLEQQTESNKRQTSSSECNSSCSGSSSSSDDSQDSLLTELKPSTPEICQKLIANEKKVDFETMHNLDKLETAAARQTITALQNADDLEPPTLDISDEDYLDAGAMEKPDPDYVERQNKRVDETIAAVLAMAKDPKASIAYEDAKVSSALNMNTTNMKAVVRHRAPNGTRTQHYCAFCPKVFPSKAQFEKHIRVHTGEKPYVCHFCSATFGRKDRLRMHIRIHTGEKPHHCENCDSKFTTREQLVKHVKVHTGQKDYICSECDKRFAEKSDLKRHVLIHTDQRPFDCKTCGRSFKRKYSLQVHIRLHTGEKPYTCLTCDKAFHTSSHLSSHIQTNHL